MWILSQEGQGSRYQLHHFLGFNVCVEGGKKRKLKTIKLQASTEVYEFNRI